MLKCILWGSGKVFYENVNLIKFYEITHEIEVLGITSNTTVFDTIAGWKYVKKSELKNMCFDLVIVMADRTIRKIEEEARGMGIHQEKIISYRVLKLPEFSLKKYLYINKRPPSIFSNNCWGGITYHSLGLPFCSPFINMFVKTEDYIKFLKEPEKYIEEELVLKEEGYNEALKITYPICTCADIKLYFNHYDSFEKATETWERRKKRIDWDNLFVMMYTENPGLAEEFVGLRYDKKICFVPFATETHGLCSISFATKGEMEDVSFAQIVSGMAKGIYPYYNVLDLLCEGKIKELGKN